ncbi:hypothetical protein PPL_01858 [Heterostelium album PN500]|uniref:Uncharacterized protein n=1 Tax=Heterostelium pallidum (strain ATCC 26659 / Pp 5 / PN500) TaxID=670386 RepID=D3B0P1_HETP5|nr:hypothetical protein PPL_01858 [Heterostelium album PN500]EFA84865.1 hypothetical protein PPL_01858 [Heterostelium album PN500]|eukprot:XP_020436976.1 hypothetical protein PPL_01858 [Heterostelium album PN500]
MSPQSVYTGVFTNTTLTTPVPTNLSGSVQLIFAPNPLDSDSVANVTLLFIVEGIIPNTPLNRIEIHSKANVNSDGPLLRRSYPLGLNVGSTFVGNQLYYMSQIDGQAWYNALQTSTPTNGVYMIVQYQQVWQLRAQLTYSHCLPEPTPTPSPTETPATTTGCSNSCTSA